MNILMVDDQREIVNSLKNGIRWDTLPVEQVYTACSAKEAKLVLVNFQVDVLITDIEMPEENGLALCQWARENISHIELVLLTSHPDFKYAQEAIRLGVSEYILQPVRYGDVETVIRKLWTVVEQKQRLSRQKKTRDLVASSRNTILDAMLSKLFRGKTEDARLIFEHFREMFEVECGPCRIWPVLVKIQRWKKITNIWDEKLVRLVLANVIEEMFEDCQAKAAVSCVREQCHWVFLVLPGEAPAPSIFTARIEEFYRFLNSQMDFMVSVYCIGQLNGESCTETIVRLNHRDEQNGEKKIGVFWDDLKVQHHGADNDFIEFAMEYVKKNISKNILRSEVAQAVHMNEDYFSRVFKIRTGVTFKDYVLIEKIKTAQFLLANTRLSIGIIASKVGYDNFSHFSKMFKKMINQTPQEYRRDHCQDSGISQ